MEEMTRVPNEREGRREHVQPKEALEREGWRALEFGEKDQYLISVLSSLWTVFQ